MMCLHSSTPLLVPPKASPTPLSRRAVREFPRQTINPTVFLPDQGIYFDPALPMKEKVITIANVLHP